MSLWAVHILGKRGLMFETDEEGVTGFRTYEIKSN
jgi:hypothetical protein